MKFEPTIIEEFARRLTVQARNILGTYTLSGVLIATAGVLYDDPDNSRGLATAAVVGGLIGFAFARDRA